MKKEVTCYCEHRFFIECDEEIDTQKNPKILGILQSAQFQKGDCPQCGTSIHAEFFTRFIFPDKKITLAYIPEQDRFAFLNDDKNNASIQKIQKDDQIVIGFLELLDRIAVLQADLDPLVMECIKYFLLEDAYEKFSEVDSIFMLFKRVKENGDFEFNVYGIEKDKAALIDVPGKVYEQVKTDIEQKVDDELYKVIQNGNYISVENILFEDEGNGEDNEIEN